MKRFFFIAFLAIVAATSSSCNKDAEIPFISYAVEDVNVDASQTTCVITCKNESVDGVSIHLRVLIDEDKDFSSATQYEMLASNGQWRCEVPRLSYGTQYYYCFEIFSDIEACRINEVYKFIAGTSPFVFQSQYVTDSAAMDNGTDASWLKGSQLTLGWNCQYWVGSSFTLQAVTIINEIEVYGYQTGSDISSTFTGLYVQIYNNNPMNDGIVIFGDVNTNIMTRTAFTNCYRGDNGKTKDYSRPIMSITASDLNIELNPGTYWFVCHLDGVDKSGLWTVPHCKPVVGNTGKGVVYTGTNWVNLVDSGTNKSVGIAMKLSGVAYSNTANYLF